MIQKLHKFWFTAKIGFPNGMNILLTILLFHAILNFLGYRNNDAEIQSAAILTLAIFLSVFSIFTVGLIILKSHQDKIKKT